MAGFKLFELGIEDDLQDYLNKKIRLTNQVAFAFLFINTFFLIFCALYYPQIIRLTLLGYVFSAFALLSNYWKNHTLARLLMSLGPLVMATLLHAAILSEGQPPVTGFSLVQVSLFTICFLLIEFREKAFHMVVTLAGLILFIGVPYISEWLPYTVDDQIVRNGMPQTILMLSAFVLVNISLSILLKINSDSEEMTIQILSRKDEDNIKIQESQTELQANLAKLEAAREEERIRNWQSKGVSEILEILRHHDDNERIYDQLIMGLVKYVNANQGKLFTTVKEGSDIYLRLVSAYAYSRKKFLEQKFAPGQGLVGQTYLEGNSTYLKKIPDNYITIKSGMGEAPPRNLIIVPMIYDGITEGVFEIASFQEFKDYELDFLNNIGETLASSIKNVKTNRETQSLLRKSQVQAEELRAQEEEMRQNQEEMQATQEEMYRKEQEYIQRIKELEAQKV